MEEKDKIKFKFQRAKKGFCDYDLYSIDYWFINIFPRMLGEFVECTCGYPSNEEELIEEAKKFPGMWKERQRPIINKILKKYDSEYDLNDSMCCWLLIILRMKHCFERLDEMHEGYEELRKAKFYNLINDNIQNFKKQAFYLFEKYFFDLWW